MVNISPFTFNIFLILLNIIKISNYIVIPFKTHIKTLSQTEIQNYNSKTFIENEFTNNIYELINVGNPSNIVQFFITTRSLGINIGYRICSQYLTEEPKEGFSKYSINNSNTYKQIRNDPTSVSNFMNGIASNESMKFINDINDFNKVITINNIEFVYTQNYEESEKIIDNKICGLLGMELYEKNSYSENFNFILNLNRLGIIKSYVFYFKYNTNNEGILVIGEEPHIVLEKEYKEYQLRTDNAINENNLLTWGTQFNNIYFLDENNSNILINEVYFAKFIPELNFIIGTLNYKKYIDKYFFDQYITKGICRYNKEYSDANGYKGSSYYILSCDLNSDFNIQKFPTLYFFHRLFNYTFELTYKDLFITKEDKIYFLLIFSYYDQKHYEFGKIFLKKYLFTFNSNSKLIGFYNKNIQPEFINRNNSNLYLLLISICILILVALIVFLGKILYNNSRKKRYNEIDENYEYKYSPDVKEKKEAFEENTINND